MEGLRTIQRIGLVVKKDKPQAAQLALEMEAWLQERGAFAFIATHEEEDFSSLLPQTDLVLSLGGDGTLISVARKILGKQIPLAGVNFGRVGFLAELAPATWQACLTKVLAQGVRIASRMTLGYRLLRSGCVYAGGEVINDVVLTRGERARLVRLQLHVAGEPLSDLRSDGIICSTPTGVTGYARAAGGPLLQPDADDYVVVPICPFLNTFPPLVLNCKAVFRVQVCEGGTNLYLTLDGQDMHPVMAEDVLEVFGLPGRFQVADLGVESFFTRLCRVGFIR